MAEREWRQPAKIYVNGRFLQQPITGIQRYGRELLQSWDKFIERGEIDPAEVVIEVLVPRAKVNAPELRHIRVRQAGWLRGQLWTQLELPAFSRDGLLFSPDNLHPLLFPLIGPGVVTVHDLTFRLFPQAHTTPFRLLYSVLIPSAIRNASALVTSSEAERENIVGHYPMAKGRIAVVHLGAPRAEETSSDQNNHLTSAPAERYILWVGSLISRKNPQGAIQAAAIVNRRMRLPLVVVGSGHRGMQKTGIRLGSVNNAVKFAGRVISPDHLVGLYQSAVCLLFPTFYEGFGLPALEAMAYGCPVVTSDIPVMREVCGEAALYCDPNSPEDIADKVKMLADNPELRAQLAHRGFSRAAQFSWERCARETFQVLQQVMIRNAGRNTVSESRIDL